jgi:hypothetical protein
VPLKEIVVKLACFALQHDAKKYKRSAAKWREEGASVPGCPGCPGGAGMPRRVAASYAAYAAFAEARYTQLCEELKALRKERRYRALAAPVYDLGCEEECVAAMRAVPATDLCSACHQVLDKVSMLGLTMLCTPPCCCGCQDAALWLTRCPPHACLQPWVVQLLCFATLQIEAFDDFFRRDVQRLISQYRRDGKQFGNDQAQLAEVQQAGGRSNIV